MKTPLEQTTPLSSLVKGMIRVNHAGEFSAKRIYEGQLSMLQDPHSRALVQHMAAQEAVHLEKFSELCDKHHVPPTKLLPLWDTISYGLGVVSGALGPKAAMACTMAVEEVIETHYENQIKRLQDIQPSYEQTLQNTIGDCLADERDHHNLAKDENAEDLLGFSFLKKSLQVALKVAIGLSERT